MTTITQIVKAGKVSFIPSMLELGFEHHGKLCFSKCTSSGVHHIISSNLSYGENLTFHVTCIVAEYSPQKMENFPFNVPVTSGGELGEDLIAGELWEVGDVSVLENVLSDVLSKVRDFAMPWLESVQSREDYVRELYPHLREKLEALDRLDAVLTGG